ncbi:hypothetical protein [Gottfriedia acidiceleris]|uniref:hypothetical protein n=1 Tax=Gottfriedia acidiceleris TaxID=371036 RepID=UPI003D1AB787
MEKRKHLLHLLIDNISIDEKRSIESISIAINKELIKYLSKNGEDKLSFVDELSSSYYLKII